MRTVLKLNMAERIPSILQNKSMAFRDKPVTHTHKKIMLFLLVLQTKLCSNNQTTGLVKQTNKKTYQNKTQQTAKNIL